MPSARFWPGGRLLAGWAAAIAGFFVLRWVLVLGVVRGVLRDGRVHRLGGIWSSGFAALMTAVVGSIVVAVLVWLTASWFAGRSERRALRRAAAQGHRRILM